LSEAGSANVSTNLPCNPAIWLLLSSFSASTYIKPEMVARRATPIRRTQRAGSWAYPSSTGGMWDHLIDDQASLNNAVHARTEMVNFENLFVYVRFCSPTGWTEPLELTAALAAFSFVSYNL